LAAAPARVALVRIVVLQDLHLGVGQRDELVVGLVLAMVGRVVNAAEDLDGVPGMRRRSTCATRLSVLVAVTPFIATT